MSISRILEISKRSLLAYQSAIKTTTDNISNANNEYYKRRRVNFNELNSGYGALGLNVDDTRRLRQRFAEYQIYSENQLFGKYKSTHRLLSQIEGIFDENSDSGLSKVLNDFYSAWNDLAQDPESDYARNLVVDKGMVLADNFQRINGDLQNIKDQIKPEVKLQLKDINQKLRLLQKINRRIRVQTNPDLLDQRDKILDDLSQKISLKIKEKENGEVNVYSDGILLVSYDTLNELKINEVTKNNTSQLQVVLKSSGHVLNMDNGEIAGLLEMNNSTLPEYKNKLDELARGLAEAVNKIHRQGENAKGVGGLDFFDSDIKGMADFKVNQAIINDPSLVASRRPGEAVGSGSIASDISDLQSKSIFNEGTAHEYYQSFLTQLGDKVQEADFNENSQKMIIDQLKNQRDAVTGVSMDEEMTQMVQYQQAYSAAAKMVNTVDQMMTTVLQMV